MKPIDDLFLVSTFTEQGFKIDKGPIKASDTSDLKLEPALFTDVSLLEPDSAV